MPENAMSNFLTETSLFFEECISWIGEILTVVTSNPALLILVVLMPVVGFAFGLLGRLLRA